MSEPILKAEHLGITFGGLKAVSDFNMTINSGELVGLIGPNGAGKTTVFNLLTGVYQPTEGEFFLDGERMNGKKTYQVVRAGIARTFQNIRLFGQMTVEENVLVAFNESFSYHMGGAIFRTPKFWKQEREMHAKAIDLLKIFGLEGLAETEAANLPYGAQRKLEIARALATGMKLLLLDEPAAGMNPTYNNGRHAASVAISRAVRVSSGRSNRLLLPRSPSRNKQKRLLCACSQFLNRGVNFHPL